MVGTSYTDEVDTSESAFRESLAAAFQHSIAHLENLNRSPVGATASLEALRNRLGKSFADDGIAPDQVISELVKDVAGGIIGSAGGRYFAGVVGGSLPAALAAGGGNRAGGRRHFGAAAGRAGAGAKWLTSVGLGAISPRPVDGGVAQR